MQGIIVYRSEMLIRNSKTFNNYFPADNLPKCNCHSPSAFGDVLLSTCSNDLHDYLTSFLVALVNASSTLCVPDEPPPPSFIVLKKVAFACAST